MTAPLASCIMPTRDRRAFVPKAIRNFLEQDYEPRELLILDDGEDAVRDCIPDDDRISYRRQERRLSIGAKRNALCREARGEIILHWDDDDWYPAWRTRRQVEALLSSPSVTVSGTSTHYYHEPSSGRAWRYQYVGPGAYVTGATLAYRKSFWQGHAFADVQVGEDTKLVQSAPRGTIVDLGIPSLCVGTIHAGNVSRKWPAGPSWTPVEAELVSALVDGASGLATSTPTASCIMPTSDRRALVALALQAFAAQEGVTAELIVVDSGGEPVDALCRGATNVRYVRVQPGASIGVQRNVACEHARGDVIVHWDDDDWYAPSRLKRQLEPIVSGRADVTGIDNRFTLNVRDATFWTTTPQLHRRMFVGDVHGGTLAYRRSLLARGVRYKDVNLAEDAALLTELLRRGARLERVPNDGVFVYTRHGRNAWRFEVGAFVDPAGWSRTAAPATMPVEVIASYGAAVADSVTTRTAVHIRGESTQQSFDCLGNTRLVLPSEPVELERCVAFAVTEAHASLLEGALASLARFGGLPGVPRVVFINETAPACESIATRYGALVFRCRLVRGHAPSIKGALYSMSRVIKAKQYLCLDADILVQDTLTALFHRHAELGRGKVLVAPEATATPVANLRDALASVYRATPEELRRLVGADSRLSAEPHVLNDGVFVADFDALTSLDALLRGDEALRAWVNARRDVWWRHKGAFNVALARLGSSVLLDPTFNAQLHVEPARKCVVKGRVRAQWRGALASILHFNGRGRSAYRAWREEFDSTDQVGASTGATRSTIDGVNDLRAQGEGLGNRER